MRFALLGQHPDGLAFAAALVDSGRHQVVACTAGLDDAERGRLGGPRPSSDVEEVLADPAVEAVIVAGAASVRAEQLRRALQSERHAVCAHPLADRPDAAYEAAMLQADTGYSLTPLLPEGLHPAIARLAGLIDRTGEGASPSPVGAFQMLLFERAARGEVLAAEDEGQAPALPIWDVLRRLGGEVAEVSSFADGEEVELGRPVLLAGRFERGGLYQVTLLPRRPAGWWRLVVIGDLGQAELTLPQGWHGPAILGWGSTPEGEPREEYFEPFDAWPAVVEQFEAAAEKRAAVLTWQDAVRMLELDDAARRSVQRRRVNLMEYQEANEEVGFKGTMTLVGCVMLWVVLGLLIASRWAPWLGWLVLPLLLVFIGLQLFRYVIPAPPPPPPPPQQGR